MQTSEGAPLELWAGLECTVNRVRDGYLDQLELSGHSHRLSDLDLLLDVGAKAVRYPVLWERVAPEGPASADWSWPDERLSRLRELGVRPIVGLVHHGSGPPHTSLVDDAFPELLAEYAGAVAKRYPWVEEWTPVNEPLTTARFSCLYGFWYPHRRDALSFARALLIQLRAIVLAMRAIREHVPGARLVQTDDLGTTRATPALAYQAEHENERRWVTWDLLCGRRSGIDEWFEWVGVPEGERRWFEENPCPPDVVGINHYLSSDRFLDHRLDLYPEHLHGSNGKDAYVDELAARILAEDPTGPADVLRQAWERYELPIAVTEAHNGCTCEEQLRWLLEVWRSAELVRDEGVDVRAVTVWTFLGAYGWDRLVTGGGRYEPGVYDLRGPAPRPTALAGLARALSEGSRYDHPAADGPGWWRRPERLWYPPVSVGGSRRGPIPYPATRPILVTGRTGTLGQAAARACTSRGLPHRLVSRQELDAAEQAAIEAALDAVEPWAVVNTVGFVRVDDAEHETETCRRENVAAAALLAEACARRGIPYVTFSSDLVFDGAKGEPYVEGDPPRPLNVYGETKLEAERRVLEAWPEALVVRTSAFFGPVDEHNFVTVALRALAAGETFRAADDAIVSPTYVPDLVDATLDLLIDGESGVWHLANEGETTWAELAANAAAQAGVRTAALVPVPTEALGLAARRPRYSALGSERGVLLPPLDDALARYTDARLAA